MKTIEVELAVADLFGIRQQMAIITNLSWGFGLRYEADLVVLTKAGYLYEIEIKVSRADLLRDKKKGHSHGSNLFRQFYFAVPKNLRDIALEHIPLRAGLIVCDKNETDGIKYQASVVRNADINYSAPKITEKELVKLLRLGTMRQWTAKRKLVEFMNRGWLRLKSEIQGNVKCEMSNEAQTEM